MKDNKQNIIVVLLIANLVVVIFLGVGLGQLKSNMNSLEHNFDTRISSIAGNINYEITEALQKDKYRVAYTDVEFLRPITDDEIIIGNIYFELTDNTDIENVYVVIDDEKKETSRKVLASTMGELKYNAQITLPYTCNHSYYVISESADGKMKRISDEYFIGTMSKIRDLAYIETERVTAHENGFSTKGRLYIHEEQVVASKVEMLIVSYENDGFLLGEECEAKVLDTFDITNSLVTISKGEITEYDNPDDETIFNVYKFDIQRNIDLEKELFAEGFIEFEVVITFDDGLEISLLGY